ncbi:MAG: class I SAM-dependent methyltransferase [Legionellales bacterium]|nr:class I SAM-dependent methyltransferase [Legionellales bacterium]
MKSISTPPVQENSLSSLPPTNSIWANKDNIAFYDDIEIETLKNLAQQGGIADGYDVNLIFDHIKNTKKILEVGAGYGRVISFLLKHHYYGRIVAVEKSQRMCEILKSQFNSIIKLYHTDILLFQTKEKFDVILWLWSGICDFNKYEQPLIIKSLVKKLESGGKLIIDSLSPTHTPVSSENNQEALLNRDHLIKVNNEVSVHAYLPTPQEITSYAEQLAVNSIEHMPYITPTQRNRNLYIIQK